MEEIFSIIRKITVGLLIISVALLVLVGILGVWDVLPNGSDVLGKSFFSMVIMAISTGLIVISTGGVSTNHKFSLGKLILWAILIVIGLAILSVVFSLFGAII